MSVGEFVFVCFFSFLPGLKDEGCLRPDTPFLSHPGLWDPRASPFCPDLGNNQLPLRPARSQVAFGRRPSWALLPESPSWHSRCLVPPWLAEPVPGALGRGQGRACLGRPGAALGA